MTTVLTLFIIGAILILACVTLIALVLGILFVLLVLGTAVYDGKNPDWREFL